MMKSGPLKIGIACFPLIGGSGILATALGSELARRGHEVYFFSYAQPVRLDLPQDNLHFHRVDVAHNPLFPSPDYTLPLAVKMAEVARLQQLDLFHVHYAVPHALAACLASQMLGPSAPRLVTTLHGTDTTLLGQDPDYRTAIEHALVHSDAVTAVSESLRNQTQETFRLKRSIDVIPNFSLRIIRSEAATKFAANSASRTNFLFCTCRVCDRSSALIYYCASLRRRRTVSAFDCSF